MVVWAEAHWHNSGAEGDVKTAQREAAIPMMTRVRKLETFLAWWFVHIQWARCMVGCMVSRRCKRSFQML